MQGDEPRVLSGALEQTAAVIELPAPVEEQGRVLRKGTDPDDILATDRVANDLPHVATGPGRLALIADLLGLRRGGPHGPAGVLHALTPGRGGPLSVNRYGGRV